MVNEKILVVDDEDEVRDILVRQLNRIGYKATGAADGEAACDELESFKPNLVLTDLIMPRMDGLAFLRHIRDRNEKIPVVIITGHGNLEDAIVALRLGANDFITKPFELKKIFNTLSSIFTKKYLEQIEHSAVSFITDATKRIVIDNDIEKVSMVSYYLVRDIKTNGMVTELEAENFAIAIREALINAIYHGNLEVKSNLREDTEYGLKKFKAEIEKKRSMSPYKERRVVVNYDFNYERVLVRIEDEGPGFDHQNLPDPTKPENLLKSSGRGIFMLRIHSDEVAWEKEGKVITLKKLLRPPGSATAPSGNGSSN